MCIKQMLFALNNNCIAAFITNSISMIIYNYNEQQQPYPAINPIACTIIMHECLPVSLQDINLSVLWSLTIRAPVVLSVRDNL